MEEEIKLHNHIVDCNVKGRDITRAEAKLELDALRKVIRSLQLIAQKRKELDNE